MLAVRGITKAYGDVEALRGVDLDVGPGSIVALLGRNGAGKTTLLSIIAGLVGADGGTVEVDGVDITRDPDAVSRSIGIAPQETGIYPVLTVRENLEFFCDLAGVERRQRRARADEVAERLGLTALLERKGSQLSGGEARRLHTACALVDRPPLLMLDEPTVGADVATRRQLIDVVRAMAAEGAAVVYTTHYLPEVEALHADVVIIDDGRILARGGREQLIADHHLGGLRFTIDRPLDGGLPPGLVVERLDGTGRPGARGGDGAGDEGQDGEGQGGDGRGGDGEQTPGPVDYLAVGDVTMAELLAWLGPDAARLLAVERNLPDLESVFLAVTGRDLSGDGGG